MIVTIILLIVLMVLIYYWSTLYLKDFAHKGDNTYDDSVYNDDK